MTYTSSDWLKSTSQGIYFRSLSKKNSKEKSQNKVNLLVFLPDRIPDRVSSCYFLEKAITKELTGAHPVNIALNLEFSILVCFLDVYLFVNFSEKGSDVHQTCWSLVQDLLSDHLSLWGKLEAKREICLPSSLTDRILPFSFNTRKPEKTPLGEESSHALSRQIRGWRGLWLRYMKRREL